MSYRGNPALDPEMQERIEHTFSETRGLIREGKLQQAVLGCEFILKMDPAYAPAQTLLERLHAHMAEQQVVAPVAKPAAHSPDQATREIPVVPLEPKAPPAPAAAPAPPQPAVDLEPLADLEPLDDLGDLEELTFDNDSPSPAPASEAAAPPAGASGLTAMLQDLLVQRNYSQILQLAESQQQALQGDPQLQLLVEQARERHEADAFVQNFLDSARQAWQTDDLAQAQKLLQKARTLDAEHPDVIALTAEFSTPEESSKSVSLGDGELVFAAPEAEGDTFAELPSLELPVADANSDLQIPSSIDLSAELPDAADLAASLVPEPAAVPEPEVVPEPAAVADLEDFSAPSEAATTGFAAEAEDSELRVDQLLEQGQEASDRGDYQQSIDIWSRIFLVDLDHQGASDRIEEARNKKAELERQAEEAFHESLGMIERQENAAAKQQLKRVLELHPNHHLAHEYLDQLEQGKVPTVTMAKVLKDPAAETAEGTDELDVPELIGGPTADSPSLEAAVQRDRMVAVKKKDWRLIGLAAALVVGVLAGGYFIATNWNKFFANTGPSAASTGSRPRVDLIARATAMHEGGNTENAINMLQRLPPDDDRFEEAQKLLEQWAALVEPEPEGQVSAVDEELLAQIQELVAEAQQAHVSGHLLRAREAIGRAAKLSPLSAEAMELRSEIDHGLEPLKEELELYAEKRFRDLIPRLWRIRDRIPGDLDVQQLLVDSYYNLAVRHLRRGNPKKAQDMLTDALEIEPANEQLRRLELFASAYSVTAQDLLYRIFVKYLS